MRVISTGPPEEQQAQAAVAGPAIQALAEPPNDSGRREFVDPAASQDAYPIHPNPVMLDDMWKKRRLPSLTARVTAKASSLFQGVSRWRQSLASRWARWK